MISYKIVWWFCCFAAVDDGISQLLYTGSRSSTSVPLRVGKVNNTIGISVTISDRYGASVEVDAGNVYVSFVDH